MTTCFQPLLANKEFTTNFSGNNTNDPTTSAGSVRRLAYHTSPITLINDGTEATITFYQAYTNCRILVYKDVMFFSTSTYATIPAGYMETLTFDGPGSYEIDIQSEGKTIYSTELSIE
jgi:hypothetical protein